MSSEPPEPEAPETNPDFITIIEGHGNIGVAIAIASLPILIVVIAILTYANY